MQQTLPTSRKRCSRDSTATELFFSLMDYRNNLFISNEIEDVIKFYDSFQNRDDLIEWMKERPRGATYIHEVEGDRGIIVVIPTADFNGLNARECRENIFNGLHIIFVESGEIPDPYFNYAHSCNVGIKKAMEYKPKWVILSNDDMYGVDGIEKLESELSSLSGDIQVVFAKSPEHRFGIKSYIGKSTVIYSIFNVIRGKPRLPSKVSKWIKPPIEIISEYYVRNDVVLKIVQTLLVKPVVKHAYFNLIMSFGIFAGKFIAERGGKLLDETYINGNEDVDISFTISLGHIKSEEIDYKIGDLVGKGLGLGRGRYLRGLAGAAYFYEKHKEKLEGISVGRC